MRNGKSANNIHKLLIEFSLYAFLEKMHFHLSFQSITRKEQRGFDALWQFGNSGCGEEGKHDGTGLKFSVCQGFP